MLVSYKWLQTYFKDPLPSPKELEEVFTMGVFEIESLEKKGEDSVFDVKTLADRNPYALSHRYMAYEIGALLKQPVVFPQFSEAAIAPTKRDLAIVIEDNSFCIRYIGRVVEGVSVGGSPPWLKEKLEALGQRSINVIVDLANFVMLDTGQPLHAFDADKVEGNITVRKAKAGEEIVVLDGKTIKLDPSIFIIADNAGALAIAGVKGGKRAEVTTSTKNLILEAATFNGTSVRRTAQLVGIRNDSTKRFENQITPERALLAINELSALIAKENVSAVFSALVDVHDELPPVRIIDIKIADIEARMGIVIPHDALISILKSLSIGVEEKTDKEGAELVLTIPEFRSDLLITEDIVEEVGRIYGYEHVEEKLPAPVANRPINKNFYYYNLIRKAMSEYGWSEVLTYTLCDEGDIAMVNPLNAYRGFMRNNISRALEQKLGFNLRNADLLGLTAIRIFEIGRIFGDKKERTSFAFGLAYAKAPKGLDIKKELTNVAEVIGIALGSSNFTKNIKIIGNTAEIDIDESIEKLPDPKVDVEFAPLDKRVYQALSVFPFAVRDVAVFVPNEESEETKTILLDIIKKESRGLLVRCNLFDVFTKKKEGDPMQTSYAYRMVFQAKDRTLTEDDINSVMARITDDMNSREGWRVR